MPSMDSGTFRRDCSLEGFLEEGVRRSRALLVEGVSMRGKALKERSL